MATQSDAAATRWWWRLLFRLGFASERERLQGVREHNLDNAKRGLL